MSTIERIEVPDGLDLKAAFEFIGDLPLDRGADPNTVRVTSVVDERDGLLVSLEWSQCV